MFTRQELLTAKALIETLESYYDTSAAFCSMRNATGFRVDASDGRACKFNILGALAHARGGNLTSDECREVRLEYSWSADTTDLMAAGMMNQGAIGLAVAQRNHQAALAVFDKLLGELDGI